ncbi:ABC transporter substrate-binding protein [Singulisphaera sp. GP187]|uniref:ABC transporter substrate-binding protein n=1 Tax=Singulisphaera sp. GP187 TaxID=1882752 RepID=UPI0020B14660
MSLLPSLTELVCALGHQGALVGVTHECDYPVGVEQLPHLTRSRIAAAASSAAIDAAVVAEGGSLYELDGALLAQLCPDLILTQEQCDVCAVNEATVRRVAAGLPGLPRVESVNPTCLADLDAMFRRIGVLLGAEEEAEALIARFDATVAAIARRRQGRPLRRVLVLEWFDPPFSSGHWNPEIVALAGGVEVIGEAGQRSRRLSWDEVAEADPELIVLSPCGFTIARTEEELSALEARPEWSRLEAVRSGGVTLVDGSAYFSRPGPRLEMSLKIAAAAIDPEACGDLAPREGWRRLPAV